jgi:phosphoglycolate phosphatase
MENGQSAAGTGKTRGMTYKAVLFDLDGTLLDTVGDLADAMNAALAAVGAPPHDVAAAKFYVGDGLRNYVVRALPEGRRQDEPTIARVSELFRGQYARNWHVQTRPYDGIPELLDALTARGLPMTVLSNKPDDFTKLMVARILAKWRFAAVRGVEPGGVTKPDPSGAIAMAEQLGLAAAEFLYLGDTNTDMRTAVAAGMFPVGATWGFRPLRELLDNGAAAIIDHPMELLKLL